MFDLTGAAFSHSSAGDPAGKVITPLVLLALVAVSWALRPEARLLGRLLPAKGASTSAHGEPARATA
jgi:hypothetical protein